MIEESAAGWAVRDTRIHSPIDDTARAMRLQSQQGGSFTLNMSRNFYILAGVLLLFALLSGGMSLVPSSFQPGLPANGTLWRTTALILLLAGLAFALIGIMSNLFEQVDRHSEESRRDARRRRRNGEDV